MRVSDVTSISREYGWTVKVEDVRRSFADSFGDVFGAHVQFSSDFPDS